MAARCAMRRRASMNCAVASTIYEQKEGEAMTGKWQEHMLAALAMLGAGLEGMGLEMA
jgi:hypothetical protein